LNKTFFSIIAISLLLASSFFVFPASSLKMNTTSNGSILYVGGTGFGNFSKIQDAINASSDGDTVFVYNGTYYENIVVNKSITLQGQDDENTVINATIEEDTIIINADNVQISKFNITNNFGKCSIYINGNNSLINENLCENSITLYSSSNSFIKNNTIKSGGISLFLSNNNEIIYNIIYQYFWHSNIWGSSDNIIKYNIFDCLNIGTGIFLGTDLYETKNNIISYNLIKNCDTGIDIYSGKNEITNNDFNSNDKNIVPRYNGIRFGNFNKIFVFNTCKIRNNYWNEPLVSPKIIIDSYMVGNNGPNGIAICFAWDPTPAREPNCDFGGET